MFKLAVKAEYNTTVENTFYGVTHTGFPSPQ